MDVPFIRHGCRESFQDLRLITPHAWALDAYRQLLATPAPAVEAVARCCGALTLFGVVFVGLSWWLLRLE
jgi:ABC-2 type transport system permease protein